MAFSATLACTAAQGAEKSERLQRIASTHQLRVCIWPDYYGISYRNPKSLQLSGIDIDNARDLAKALDAEPVFVDSSFARLVDDVWADRCGDFGFR